MVVITSPSVGDRPEKLAEGVMEAPKPKVPSRSTLLTSAGDDDDFLPTDLFEEPADFRPPTPPPTITHFDRETADDGGVSSVHISLVGKKHSLWGHRLWNAGLSMARWLDAHPQLCRGRKVLELGAASALPSIIASLNGAMLVVSTDYPDPELLSNIAYNARTNVPTALERGAFRALGFQWGQDATELLGATKGTGFDLILMADLIFNHTEQANMLKTCKECLSPGGAVYTTFSHHVVKWADRDLRFFDIAADMGFAVEKLYAQKWSPMFPEDEGDLEVRSTVHGYLLTLPPS